MQRVFSEEFIADKRKVFSPQETKSSSLVTDQKIQDIITHMSSLVFAEHGNIVRCDQLAAAQDDASSMLPPCAYENLLQSIVETREWLKIHDKARVSFLNELNSAIGQYVKINWPALDKELEEKRKAAQHEIRLLKSDLCCSKCQRACCCCCSLCGLFSSKKLKAEEKQFAKDIDELKRSGPISQAMR